MIERNSYFCVGSKERLEINIIYIWNCEMKNLTIYDAIQTIGDDVTRAMSKQRANHVIVKSY